MTAEAAYGVARPELPQTLRRHGVGTKGAIEAGQCLAVETSFYSLDEDAKSETRSADLYEVRGISSLYEGETNMRKPSAKSGEARRPKRHPAEKAPIHPLKRHQKQMKPSLHEQPNHER